MKRKNLALRMSACMMSALLVVGSAVPAYAAEDVAFEDQITDAVADGGSEENVQAGDEVVEDVQTTEAADSENTDAEETEPVEDAGEVDADTEETQDSEVTDEEAGEIDGTDVSGEVDADSEADQNEDPSVDEITEAENENPNDEEGLTTEEFSDSTTESDSNEVVLADNSAEAAEVQTGFGTANTQLAAGTYQVTVSLKNVNDITSDSKAASCIAGKGTLVVAEDGSAKLTVPIQAANVMGNTAYAKDWKVYSNGPDSETTDAEFTTDENGNVNSITFTIPDKAQDGVYVSMYIDLMQSTQKAFANVDYANAEAEKVAVDTSALEATIAQADALDEMAYTKASWDGNKDAIETAKTAAKAALEAKESQEAVDAADTALADAMSKLTVAGDPAELQAAVDQAKALEETDYTVKSVKANWSKIQDNIVAAENAIAGRETDKNLASIKNNLNKAIKGLSKAYNTENLEKLISKAEALKESDYTADSWKDAKLSLAIASAKDVITARGNKNNVHVAMEAIENAMDKLVADGIVVGRGNFAKKLKPGTYSVPIELLHSARAEETNDYTSANYMTQLSMAHGCFTGNATIVIHEDGTATLTTGVQAIKAMGTEGAASDWTIYEDTQGFLNGTVNSSKGARYYARVDETKVQAGKRKPSKISFTIPDLKQNVVVSRMKIEVMDNIQQDACIGIDWANIEKVSDETSATSAVEKSYVIAPDTLTQLKNIKAGDVVKLDQDVTLTEDISVKGGTIDLNGHTLDQADNLIMIKGDVTIIDSSENKGKITSTQYAEDSNTNTTISVQSGSITAENVTIEGQIGNCVAPADNSSYLTDNPRVSVKLSNCTLINSRGKDNVDFEYLTNGVDVTIDNCTANVGISVGSGTGEKTSITNSTIGQMTLYGAVGIIKNVITEKRVTIGTKETTVENDTFGGIMLMGSEPVVLKDVISTNSNGYALSVVGSGIPTIQGGVYTSTNTAALTSLATPIEIQGGYFKGKYFAVDGPYTTPDGKILGDVKEGDYAGYKTLVDGVEEDVDDPVAIIYDADGTVAKQVSEDDQEFMFAYAKEGQTVKINTDLEAENPSYFKDITIDLNGNTLSVDYGITGNKGTCRVIDSSADKSGKLTSYAYIFNANDSKAKMILDDVTCETWYIQGSSSASVYIMNGSRMSGVVGINAVMGGGKTYVQDSVWTMGEENLNGETIDPLETLAGSTRTSQYTITQTGDRSFTVTVNDLGKAMRAFEAIDASQYTKASYAAAKAIYDEIDGSADEDIQGDVIAQKAKELNDAVAALQAPASEASINALKSAITAAKKVKAADYTAASYKTYTVAITAAEKVLAGEDLSETEVTEATKALTSAKAKLVKMKAQSITVSVKNTKGVVSKKYGDAAFSLGAKAKGGLTYESSNTKIATVDKNGKVTIKSVGTVEIKIKAKATADYTAAQKVLTVKVDKASQSISVSVKNTKNVVSKKYGDKAFYLGAKAKSGLTYKSSDTKIATVDNKGKVTIKAAGTVKITITAKDTSTYKSATKVVTVKAAKAAPSIKTKVGSKTFTYADVKKKAQVFTLGTSVNSKGKLSYKKLSGTSAVTVSSTGKITVKKGLKKGTYKVNVKISAAAKGNYTAGSRTVTITVKVK